jgi:hypothetical protein
MGYGEQDSFSSSTTFLHAWRVLIAQQGLNKGKALHT